MTETCPLCTSAETSLLVSSARRGLPAREYHQCGLCRLVFVPGRFHLTPEEEKERYDLHENDPKDERYVKFLSKLTGPLAAHLATPQKGLDFGCGPGPAIAGILKEKGHEVLNFDPFYFPDRELLKGTYDFISCSEVIEHFRAPREEFMKLDRLLRSNGGTLAVMTELYGADQEKSFDQWWYTTEPTHICFYTLRTLQWIARWLDWSVAYQQGNVVVFSKMKHPARLKNTSGVTI